MKTLEEYIAESLQMYICEGFDIDRARKVVSFNANHQDNVDTNDYINPYIIMNDTEHGEMILSLFERKDNDSERGDGNPIVYALKNKKGWRFNNPKADIFALMKRFVSVTKALNSHFDTLLVSPSTNAVNKQVFKYLRRLVDFDYAIEDFFDKIPLDEIEAECDDDCINNYAKENGENPESLQRKVTKWFKDMKQNNGGVFSYQKIPAPYRKMITNAIRLSPSVYDSIDEFEEQINGKDVLVFDDTVTTGKTLSDTAEAIRATFAPNSVTFLTLFSPKASEDYSNTRVLLNKIYKIMTCNVCGKEITANSGYIDGYDCYICPQCVAKIGKLWAESVGLEIYEPDESPKEAKELMKPMEIKKFLDEHIIGQDEAKMRIAVAVYNHYKRICKQDPESPIDIDKSNVLLLGNSGTGKTMMARTIAKLLDVPFAICDATTLTQAGYVGDDVESILVKLYQNAGQDIERTQKGIVFIDEIDKIARKGGNPSITRDVSGEGVQQSLLKIIEGAVIGIPPHGGRKHPDQDLVYIDTKNILFICAGAFEGIEKRIGARLNQQSVGYATNSAKRLDDAEMLSKVSASDLRAFGLIPELIGRLPVVTHTNELTAADLRNILTEPKNSIVKQYQELLRLDGISLKFDSGALDAIVDHSIKAKTGARGLRSTMEDVMSELMFTLPSSGKTKCTVSKKYVEECLAA